ncbi:type II secretion system protein GspM [Catenovulum maritimum]|uniref:Type II secretion system protein M n=1 Tax=Catenovulum maritimum TaxID=1513271 RepID=A0A0J8JJJ5_9ALTE|nr:type II secretion system protein M [Catenovulum maritimum]KMT64616.1 hypothetical protein XM47_13310 [Catenovulum maritimum]
MKQWFESLAPRERQLVIAAGIVLVIGLFFQLVIGPLNENLSQAQSKLEKKQKLLKFVEEKTAVLKNSKSQTKRSVSGSLTQIVNNSARKSGIALARMQPQGASLQVQIDEIEFNALLGWLNELTAKQGLILESLDISQSDKTGAVKVRRLQVTKA